MENRTSPRILVLHDDADHYYQTLTERFPECTFGLCAQAESVEEAVNELKPQVVFSWKGKPLPGEAQRIALTAPSVEWIQFGGTGFDHLGNLDDVTAIATNVAGVLSPYMAETVLGAMLAMNYRFAEYVKQQQRAEWRKHEFTPMAQQTVLIVGMGTIGSQVALRAKELGMEVLGLRRNLHPDPSVDEMGTIDQLHDFLPRADFICLHVPLTDETYQLIGPAELSLMKPTATLINTARGNIVDEAALITALASNQISAAFSDVFVDEPLPTDSPLWQVENLVISPHVSDAVVGWEVMYADFFADNLKRWMAGEPLLNVVDVRRGY